MKCFLRKRTSKAWRGTCRRNKRIGKKDECGEVKICGDIFASPFRWWRADRLVPLQSYNRSGWKKVICFKLARSCISSPLLHANLLNTWCMKIPTIIKSCNYRHKVEEKFCFKNGSVSSGDIPDCKLFHCNILPLLASPDKGCKVYKNRQLCPVWLISLNDYCSRWIREKTEMKLSILRAHKTSDTQGTSKHLEVLSSLIVRHLFFGWWNLDTSSKVLAKSIMSWFALVPNISWDLFLMVL